MTDPRDVYVTAILELFRDRGEPLTIDLARPVTDGDREAFNALLGGPFAVLTACNPHGRMIGDAENEELSAQLQARLRATGTRFIRADGRSPDDNYRETGVAVSLSQPAALDLALDLEQEAYYWFDGENIWLVGALAKHEPVRLPRNND